MNYRRIIPRDLFNEGKLLKCLGFLSLKYIDLMLPKGIEMVHDEEAFEIIQDIDGNLEVANISLFDKQGEEIRLFHPLNNQSPYPLRAEIWGEDVKVFNEQGDLSEEFLSMLNRLLN